jgi:hypothetical protein
MILEEIASISIESNTNHSFLILKSLNNYVNMILNLYILMLKLFYKLLIYEDNL